MISKDKVEAVYPLSPMQEGMLFHTVEAPGAGYYIAQMDCVLRGELDVPNFRRAWQKVMDRHAVLRTAFPPLSKKSQIVFRGVKVPLTVADWRDCSPAVQQNRLKQLLDAQLQRGFDVSKAPLFALHLAQIDGRAWYFVCNFHHALLDGWSYAILLREVAIFYVAFCKAHELELPSPPKFSQYIAWLQKQDVEAAKEFWQKRLEGVKEATPLPFAGSLNAETSEERSEERLVLSPELSRSVMAFAGRHSLTPNTL